METAVANFWRGAYTIAGQGRKYGIYQLIGANDFSRDRVGPEGRNLARQLSRICLRADKHQSFVAADTSDYSSGQFAYELNRQQGDKALGFNPSQRDLQRFHERYASNGRSVLLPDGILGAIETGPSQYTIAPPSTTMTLAEQHAAKLLPHLVDCTSRTAAARIIFDRQGNVAGTDLDAADAALQWIVDNGRDVDGVAAKLLA